jgi:hypothetical protein
MVVVVPGPPEAGALLSAAGESLQVLSDREGALASGTDARIVVADEWGEVYFVSEAGAGHELASPQEVVDWVRFIVIQCPECEGPEGEWRRIREG